MKERLDLDIVGTILDGNGLFLGAKAFSLHTVQGFDCAPPTKMVDYPSLDDRGGFVVAIFPA